MRIRKNGKFSPLVYAAAGNLELETVLQPHICQLNQSPWDVTNFSPSSTPPPSQVSGNDASAGNGSSGHCISVVEKELNTWRQWEYSNDFSENITIDKIEEDKMEVDQPWAKEEQIVLCCKTDGKSWQCRKKATRGNSLCEHHMMKSYNNSAHHANKKFGKQVARHRPRAKKVSTSLSANAYGFYYYSGFGPRWGKKRGEICKDIGSSSPKNYRHEHEIEQATVSFIYDEEYEKIRNNGKKRVRKPIKARSLKSLM